MDDRANRHDTPGVSDALLGIIAAMTSLCMYQIGYAMFEVKRTIQFTAWITKLGDKRAQARIAAGVDKISLGLGDVKPVRNGVSELRIRPRIPHLSCAHRDRGCRSFVRWYEERPGQRYQGGDKARRNLEEKMTEKLLPWDAAEYLDTPEAIAEYLIAAFEDGDPRLVTLAIGNIARARGMTDIARETGLGRESLYKSLSESGNPGFSTIMKVLHALGVRLEAHTLEEA